MTLARVPRSRLASFLDALDGIGYAVAKGPDLWSNLDRGGDWDLVVVDVERSLRLLAATVGVPDRLTRRSYVTTASFSWGHIDLLPGLRWRGLTLVSAPAVVAAARVDDGGIRVASTAHQIVAACVYPLLAYGMFRERYTELLRDMDEQTRRDVERVIQQVFGRRVGLAEVLERPGEQRARAVARSLSRPRDWPEWVSFLVAELRLRTSDRLRRGARRRRAGRYIWIVGPDGCGKSSVAAAVAARSGAVLRYWRPTFLPLAGSWLRRTAPPGVNSRPHDVATDSRLKAFVRVAYYALDYVLGYVFVILPALLRGRPVIIERGWWDMVVDARRYGLSSGAWARRLGRLIRKPGWVVILSAAPGVVRHRKPELPEAEIERQFAEWRSLSWPGTVVVEVDNERPFRTVVDEVLAMARGDGAA